jgi:hypothetical protein
MYEAAHVLQFPAVGIAIAIIIFTTTLSWEGDIKFSVNYWKYFDEI